MATGFLLAYLTWLWLGRREGRSADYCSDLLLWIMVAGILGARTAYVLSDLPYYMKNPALIIRVDQGGLIYYGGFIGATVAMIVFARRRKESFMGLTDFIVTALPLGHAMGRIGCFMNGCCHGIVLSGPCTVSFPFESIPWRTHFDAHLIARDAPHSLPVVPVQLYEAAFNIALYVLLIWLYRRRIGDGLVFASYLLIYPVARFAFEFLRGDERLPGPLGLDHAQAVSILLFGGGVAVLVWALLKGKRKTEARAEG